MEISPERVLGRDKEKETIVRFLTESRCKTAVVTIWGIGGIGKTTLARLVCKDEKVQSHFHPLLWANARHAFHLNTIIEDLLELDHDRRGILPRYDLQKRLKRRIEGQTCLLVLDDVGKLAPEQCQELRDLFKVGIVGVIIATVEDQDIDLVNKDETELSRKPTQAHMTIKKKIGSRIVNLGEEVGIEDVKKNIKDFVLEESEDKLSTLFIGRIIDADTVQSMCNDVQDKFKIFKVHVPGKEFNLKRIVRCILDEEEQGKTLEQLRIELQEKLQEEKRFLITLDVHGMNAYQYDKLEVVLMKNGKVGNKLLIMTRDKQVQPIVLLAHMKMHLDFLPITESLNLFVKNAGFPEIGREIIERCMGVPLLVRVFGGILSHETDKNKLKEIQEKIKNSRPFDVSEILKLSFDTLPPHIKKCFLYSTYFTLHPQERGRLTQQWIAHALTEDLENNRKVEDLAMEYFAELLSRSFFYNLVEDDLMAEARFEVHDLVYKLAHKVSEGDESENFPSLRKLKELTFKLKNFGPSSVTLDMILDSLSRSLRVLDLSGSKFEELPSSIGELRDLRYLDVSYNIYLDELPNSLFELSNLETLRFEECGILELPRDFSKLKKLRNLYACTEQSSIPKEVIRGLASLRILHLNPVHNLETLPKSLENLTALETLVLRFCSQLTLLDTDIKGLKRLRNLTITHNHKESLFPPRLQHAAASSLSLLGLSYCLGITTLPEWLVELQCLRRLHVEFCPNLTPSPEEKISLPNCLEYLSIRGCPKLTTISERDDWQQENKDIEEIHLDERIIRSTSDARSSNVTSPSSVHVKKNIRDKGKITYVESSKLPSSRSGSVEESYEDEAMIQSTPDLEFSIPSSSSSEDLIMFDVEDQGLELAGRDNPLTTNIKDEPDLFMFDVEDQALELAGKGNPLTTNIKDEPGEGMESAISAEETESCFLLCSLFPVDRDIPIESIVRYAMGIGLFGDSTTVSQVRARVNAALQLLTELSYLSSDYLWESTSNSFRMSRRGLNFTWSAAHEREHKSFIQTGACLNKWPVMDQFTYISLMESKIEKLPEKIGCPKLLLLSLLGNGGLPYIPNSWFQGTTTLRVLDLSANRLKFVWDTFRLPPSLECLESLRSLLLDNCHLEGGLSVIGNLSKLEILSLRGSNITNLPVEIGRLNKLRLLDLESCAYLKSIPAKVISKLLKLEELYMKSGFKNWEVLKGGTAVSDDDAGKRNATFSEIQSLSSLAVFSADVDDVNCLPDDFSFGGNLTKFDLQIGKISSSTSLPNQNADIRQGPWLNNFYLIGDNHRHTHIQLASSLLPKVGHLILEHVLLLTPILSDSDEEGALNALKSLRLRDCGGLEYLSRRRSTDAVFANLEKLRLEKLVSMKGLGEGVPNPGSFQNLRILEFWECDQLSGVIPSNWNRNLPKLEQLYVCYCSSVTEIIDIEEIDKEITAPLENIKSLRIMFLEKLLSICKGPGKIISFSNLIELDISYCPKLAFIFSPYMSRTLFHLQDLSIVGCDNLGVIFEEADEGAARDEIQPLGFPELKKITVHDCEQLRSLFPVFTARGLAKLEELDISGCKNLDEIFKESEEGAVMDEIQPLGFPKLNKICIDKCVQLRSLFPVFIAQGLENLEKLDITHCKNLVELVSCRDNIRTEREANTNEIQIQLRKLSRAILLDLISFKRFCPGGYSLGLPSLGGLYLGKCPKLMELTSHNAAAYGLTNIPRFCTIEYRKTDEKESSEAEEKETGAVGKGEGMESATNEEEIENFDRSQQFDMKNMENGLNYEHNTLINELIQGFELAKQLRFHLCSSSSAETTNPLIQKILASYDKALMILNWNGSSMSQHPLLVKSSSGILLPESPISLDGSPRSEVFDKAGSKDGQENASSSSKKRTMQPKWTDQVRICSDTGLEEPQEDGYSWRKHGQKDILGAKFPRSYYRCTYRNVRDCWATKQVQRSDEDPNIFEITYRGTHTCMQGNNPNPPLPSSPEKQQELKYSIHGNDHVHNQSEDLLTSLKNGLRVHTEGIESSEMASPLSFGSTSLGGCVLSENYTSVFDGNYTGNNILDNNFAAVEQPFISPATSGSNYFSRNISFGHGFGMGQCSESDFNEIISATTSATNSPVVDLDFTLHQVDLDPNFPFSTPGFFS